MDCNLLFRLGIRDWKDVLAMGLVCDLRGP